MYVELTQDELHALKHLLLRSDKSHNNKRPGGRQLTTRLVDSLLVKCQDAIDMISAQTMERGAETVQMSCEARPG
jgi:hypothetical protein